MSLRKNKQTSSVEVQPKEAMEDVPDEEKPAKLQAEIAELDEQIAMNILSDLI